LTEIEKSQLVELAERINKEHRQVETAVGRALGHARRAGKLLVEAKGKVRHGEWLPWLEANFEGTERVAQMYMRVHSRWDEIEANTKSVSDLTLSGALRSIGAPVEVLALDRAEISSPWAAEREPGVIEQLQASPEGAEALAQINRDFVEGQTRDRVLFRISDLYYLLREVPPEDVAKDVVARHVGEAAENAVLGRADRGGVVTLMWKMPLRCTPG